MIVGYYICLKIFSFLLQDYHNEIRSVFTSISARPSNLLFLQQFAPQFQYPPVVQKKDITKRNNSNIIASTIFSVRNHATLSWKYRFEFISRCCTRISLDIHYFGTNLVISNIHHDQVVNNSLEINYTRMEINYTQKPRRLSGDTAYIPRSGVSSCEI